MVSTRKAATSTYGSRTQAPPRRRAPSPLRARARTRSSRTRCSRRRSRPVCSPALIEARGGPRTPADLHHWPLLYDLGWVADWPYWFARQGVAAPDLSRASGYRLYSMVVHAAVEGLGAAIGRPGVIARELREGSLIPIFERGTGIPARCCLITNSAQRRPDVQAFRAWVLKEAARAHATEATAPGS